MFFFLIQQFITRRAKADRGSYFHNYIQRKCTNREIKRKRRGKRKGKEIKELIDKEKEKGEKTKIYLVL